MTLLPPTCKSCSSSLLDLINIHLTTVCSVLDGNNIQFNNIYYVPVVMADEIGGDDYKVFVDATETNAAANATLAWYKIWSAAGRADPNLLVHAEANAYDPDTESTPQFDPVAVMLALELLVDGCDRMTLIEMEGIHFFEADDGMFHSCFCYFSIENPAASYLICTIVAFCFLQRDCSHSRTHPVLHFRSTQDFLIPPPYLPSVPTLQVSHSTFLILQKWNTPSR